MKVIIAGGRDFDDYSWLQECLSTCDWLITEVVSGTAAGADSLGEQWAKEHTLSIRRFPANWDSEGKAAGYNRNKRMAEYADALIAFWDGKSKGTKHMIDLAEQNGLQTIICSY